MKFQRDGPKRRRFTRRELPNGQVRQWGGTVGNFKHEREARRAGLTGKLGKHSGQGADPMESINKAHAGVYALMMYEALRSRERASAEREAGSSLSRAPEKEREEGTET